MSLAPHPADSPSRTNAATVITRRIVVVPSLGFSRDCTSAYALSAKCATRNKHCGNYGAGRLNQRTILVEGDDTPPFTSLISILHLPLPLLHEVATRQVERQQSGGSPPFSALTSSGSLRSHPLSH